MNQVIFALTLFICLVLLAGVVIFAFMLLAEVKMTKAKALLLMGYGVSLMASSVVLLILILFQRLL